MHSLYQFAEKKLGAPFHGTLEEAVEALEEIGWQVQLKENGYAASKVDGEIPENFLASLGTLYQDTPLQQVGTSEHVNHITSTFVSQSQDTLTQPLSTEPLQLSEQISMSSPNVPAMPDISNLQTQPGSYSKQVTRKVQKERDYSAFGHLIMRLPKAVQVILQLMLALAIVGSLSLPLSTPLRAVIALALVIVPVALVFSWKRPGVREEPVNPIVR